MVCNLISMQTIPNSSTRPSTTEGIFADNQPVPLRQLLVYPVVLSTANYMNLAFFNVALEALLPLFLAMPLSAGGLGFSPHTIGYIIGSYGAFSGIFQALCFPILVRVAGVRRVFVTGIAAFLPIYALFPIMSLNAREFGVNVFTWACIGIVLVLMGIMDLSYGKSFFLLTRIYSTKL
ncbi:hypothetical protein C0993_007248 [Termitomyces sp. T159_Od127]|nr:hypothetical protein C0993_007248 [Termitomyces sp. T159_Od127]